MWQTWLLAAGSLLCLLFASLCDQPSAYEFPNVALVRWTGIAAMLGAAGVISALVSLATRAFGRRLGWRAALAFLIALLLNAVVAFVGGLMALLAAQTFI